MHKFKKGKVNEMAKDQIKRELENYILANKEMHYRLAFSYVKNKEEALDIVQDSIYKAFSAIHSLKEDTYLKTWFCRIIINTSLDFLRKSKRVVVMDEQTLTSFDVGRVDHYENMDLKEALEHLPETEKSIIILRYFEDFKIKEVAEILGENINTTKARLYRALEKLRIDLKY